VYRCLGYVLSASGAGDERRCQFVVLYNKRADRIQYSYGSEVKSVRIVVPGAMEKWRVKMSYV
jgi:hypothetical protein